MVARESGNAEGQCNVPPLEEGLFDTHVSAGDFHTVLLRGDDRAAACGKNLEDGESFALQFLT